jgi:hypothetical protein
MTTAADVTAKTFEMVPNSCSTTVVPAERSPSRCFHGEQPATIAPTTYKPNPSTMRIRFRMAAAASAVRRPVRTTRIPTITLPSVAPQLASKIQLYTKKISALIPMVASTEAVVKLNSALSKELHLIRTQASAAAKLPSSTIVSSTNALNRAPSLANRGEWQPLRPVAMGVAVFGASSGSRPACSSRCCPGGMYPPQAGQLLDRAFTCL